MFSLTEASFNLIICIWTLVNFGGWLCKVKLRSTEDTTLSLASPTKGQRFYSLHRVYRLCSKTVYEPEGGNGNNAQSQACSPTYSI